MDSMQKVATAYRRDLKGVETTELYMRTGKGESLRDLSTDKLKRGMCAKSGGQLSVCHGCGVPCTVGRILLVREKRGEMIGSAPMGLVLPPKRKAELPSPEKLRELTGLGGRLKNTLEARGRTQRWLAKAIGTTEVCVWGWVKGHKSPATHMLAAICRALDVSADYLLGLEVDG